MKKAIVPLCLILFFLIVVIIRSCDHETKELRLKRTIPELKDIAENDDLLDDNDDVVTIIGFPDTTGSNPDPIADFLCQELVHLTVSRSEQILYRERYTTSYNNTTRCPNWVAWVLTRESANSKLEKRIWLNEKGEPIGINKHTANIIRGTYIYDDDAEKPCPEFADWEEMPLGMSHGHMCPAADCQTSPAAMNQSFLLTNLCVQAEKLNSGSWNRLEMKCRDLALKYDSIFIVTGPVFYDSKPTSTMGKNKIGIPDAFFKVLLCLKKKPKAIGFIYLNTNEKHNMKDAVRSVDEIENVTGLDFFPQLPNDIEQKIESYANLDDWQ